MDFVILLLASRLSGYRVKTVRLCVGALVGSIYVLAVFLPQIPFIYNMACKLLYSCLIIIVTFYPCRLKKFLTLFTYFYAVSFALGGAVYAFAALSETLNGRSQYDIIVNLVRKSANLTDILIWGFPLALLFWAILGRAVWNGLKRGLLQATLRFPISIKFAGLEVMLDGLVDTGNQLRDPLTKFPVVVVEAEILVPHLPPGFAAIMSGADLGLLQACLAGTVWENRLHLIPFISVGQQNGLMLGLVPDILMVHTPAGPIDAGKVIIGLYAAHLSHDGAYRALIHPDLLPSIGY